MIIIIKAKATSRITEAKTVSIQKHNTIYSLLLNGSINGIANKMSTLL